MNRTELIDLLERVAKEDLVEGADIYDHPCSVAIRAIDQCFNDINLLKRACVDKKFSSSKKMKLILGLNYNPSW